MDKESFVISKFSNKFIGDDGAVLGKWVLSKDLFLENSHCKIAVCEKSNGKEQCRKGNSKKGNGSEKRNHQNDGAACPFWGQYSG